MDPYVEPGRALAENRRAKMVGAVALTVTALIIALMASQSTAAHASPKAPKGHARAKIGCVNSGTVYIVYYKMHVSPAHGSVATAPNNCWNWSDMKGVNAASFRFCNTGNPTWSNVTVSGTGAARVYDDTNASHSSPSEVAVMQSSCGFGGTVDAQFNAASGCSPNWVLRNPGNFGIVLQELYCTDSGRDVTSLVNSVVPTNTRGGMVNVGANVPHIANTSDPYYPGGPCTLAVATCRANMHADIANYCVRMTTGLPITGLYSNYKVPPGQVNWVNADLNSSCYRTN